MHYFNKKVCCVLITYNPDFAVLIESLSILAPQLDEIIIVDNSDYNIPFELDESIVLLKNGKNLGIAKAQDIGVKYCLDHNADFILFMDQDSIASPNLIEHLIEDYSTLSLTSIIGAIGAMPYNRSNNVTYQTSTYRKKSNILQVKSMISSGSFVSTDILRQVGGMDETLFIDMVDSEWCWRAAHKLNCTFYLDTNCMLSHSLGKCEVNFLGKRIPLHSPNRMFYRFRNYFLLLPRGYVPFMWKLRYPFSNLIRLFLCLCVFSNKKSYLNFALKGAKEGLCFLLKLKK